MNSVAWPTPTQIRALRLASEVCVEALPVVWGIADNHQVGGWCLWALLCITGFDLDFESFDFN